MITGNVDWYGADNKIFRSAKINRAAFHWPNFSVDILWDDDRYDIVLIGEDDGKCHGHICTLDEHGKQTGISELVSGELFERNSRKVFIGHWENKRGITNLIINMTVEPD